MAGKREKPEEIVSKLRQVEVLQGRGMTIANAVRQISVTQQTFYRWRKLYAWMGRSQLKRSHRTNQHSQQLNLLLDYRPFVPKIPHRLTLLRPVLKRPSLVTLKQLVSVLEMGGFIFTGDAETLNFEDFGLTKVSNGVFQKPEMIQ